MAAARMRLMDVVLGCLIALSLLVLMPISHGRKLSRDMAAYARATADWVDAVGSLAAGEPPHGFADLRTTMRGRRVDVQHGLDLRVIEPLGPGLSAEQGVVVFTRIHDCARAVAAAERSLKHGDPTGDWSALMARDISSTLRVVADALRSQQLPTAEIPLLDVAMDEGDDIGELLAFAVSEAHGALEAITLVVAEAPESG